MFSIIVCSISPERLSNLSQNIHDTIGVEYELIGIDNRTKKWPIAKVYNEGARQARYPYLFFVHEDVKFHTKDWGQVIIEKLQEPETLPGLETDCRGHGTFMIAILVLS